MACGPLDPLSCATGAAGAVAGTASAVAGASLGNSFADAMRDGASWVIRTTIGWWLEVPSIDLVSSPAGDIRGYVWWLSLVVAAAGVIWQGLRMAPTTAATTTGGAHAGGRCAARPPADTGEGSADGAGTAGGTGTAGGVGVLTPTRPASPARTTRSAGRRRW